MKAKKVGIGVGLAGAGVFAARSLGPKLQAHCQSMCAGGKCGATHSSEEPRESTACGCAPQAVAEDTLAA